MRAALVFVATVGCSFSPSDAASDAPGVIAHDAPHVSHDAALPTPDVQTEIALVQIASAVANPWSNGAGSIAATFTAPVAPGDVVAVYVTYAGNTSVKSFGDDVGNVYTKVDEIDDGNDTQKSATGYTVATATTSTITVTFNDSKCCRALIAHELHGVDPTTPLDAHSAREQDNASSSPGNVTSSSMTTTIDRDYIFAGTSNASNENGEVITAGTGLQLQGTPPVGNGNPTVTADSIQVTPGAFTSTFTYSQGGAALTMQMAFRP